MKAIFCYDGPMHKDENGNYYDSILNDQMFERYFKVADKLELVIRTRSIATEQASKRMHRLTNPDISVCECPNLSSISGLLSGTREVKKILREKVAGTDLIFIRLPSVIGNLAVDICKQMKKKYLIEVVGCPWDSYWNYSLKGKLVAPAATYMMRTRIKSAPYVLYVTSEFLQKRYPTTGKQINCSNVELVKPDESVLANRLEKINSYSGNAVLTIGTAAGLDVLYKGQQYVIRALGELKRRGITNYRYSLIGGGTGNYLLKVAKEENVEEQIEIIGQLPHDEVFEWLDSLDIYAQPSRQEGLPRSVIEAMSRAVPCIGAKTAGIPELLEKDFVFSNGNNEIEEICHCLMEISKKTVALNAVKRNYREAMNYQRDILAERRTAFFKAYAGTVTK